MTKQDQRRYPHARYDELREQTFETVRGLGLNKGGEYSGDDDRLANFRRNGADQELPMETIWRVYAAKHWDAIGQYIKDRRNGKERLRTEGIGGRVDDLITYLVLFKAMLDEHAEDDALAAGAQIAFEFQKETVLRSGAGRLVPRDIDAVINDMPISEELREKIREATRKAAIYGSSEVYVSPFPPAPAVEPSSQ